MRVVVASDKFKGSATAAEAAASIAAGLRQVRPDLDVIEVPVADGGDGTVAAALAAAGFAAAYSLADLEPDPAVSIARAAGLLRQAGRQIAAGPAVTVT